MQGNFKIIWNGKTYTITDEAVHEERQPINHNVRMIGAMLCILLDAATSEPQDVRTMHDMPVRIKNQAQRLIDRLNESW